MLTIPNADIIEKHLKLAVGQDALPLITPDEARTRAVAIEEEMKLVGFPLLLSPWTSAMTKGVFPYPSYLIDDPRYDLNKNHTGTGPFSISGPGISCGDLLKLGIACLMKREHLPSKWPRDLKDQFLDAQSHLDAVEELYCLSRWHGVREVRTKVHTKPSDETKKFKGDKNGKDIDLAFQACMVPVQVEVKNRRREATGIVDGWYPGRNFPSYFDDLIDKFHEVRQPGVLNIAWISTHLEPNDELKLLAESFLSAHPEIDSIIVSADNCDSRDNHRVVYGRQEVRQQLDVILCPLDREESERWFIARHLERNSAEARVLEPGEVTEWLKRQAGL
jgi:hypothetical protein